MQQIVDLFTRLHFTTGLYQTAISLSGDQKLVVDATEPKCSCESVQYLISFSNLNSVSETNAIDVSYNFDKSYADNVSIFKNRSLNSRQFWHDEQKNDDTNRTTLDETNPEAYYSQYANTQQYGVRQIQNSKSKIKFFAPLWLTTKKLPTHFVILRKRKNLDLQSYPTEISMLISDGELVEVIDLKDSNIGEILKQITSDSNFTNAPLTYSVKNMIVTGINIDSGKYETIRVKSDNDSFKGDLTIVQTNSLFTSMFERNKLICSNIVNLEFIVNVNLDDSDLSLYDYFGTYVDEAQSESLKDFTQLEFTNSIYNDNKLLSISKLYNNKYKLSKDTFNQEFSGFVSVAKLQQNSYALVKENKTRQIDMSMQINPSIADYLEIITDEHNIRITASNVNNSDQFKVETELTDTIDNIVSQLQEAISLVDTYDFEIRRNDNVITIDSNMYFDDQTLILRPFANTKVNVESDTNVIELSKSFLVDTTIVIDNKHMTDELYQQLKSNEYLELNYGNSDTKIITIESITKISDTVYVNLSERFLHQISLTKPTIALYNVKYSTAIVLEFLPIVQWDKSIDEPTESIVHDYDQVSWLQEMLSLALTGVNPALDVALFMSLLNSQYSIKFDSQSLNVYIKKLKQYDSETTNNPYDRLTEQSLIEHIGLNVRANSALKWSDISGINAIGTPCFINDSIAFNLDSTLASHESINDTYANLDRSWFVIGTKPRNYANNDFHKVKSYTTKFMQAEDFYNKTNDAYQYLEHKINSTPVSYNTVNAYIVLQDHNKINYKTNTISVLFRGVYYLIDKKYLGYKFAVVLVQSAHVDVNIDIIVNSTFKTLTLLVQYAISDTFSTCLDLGTSENQYYSLDRMLLYHPAQIDTGASNTVVSRFYLDVSYPKRLSNKTFQTLQVFSDVIQPTANMSYALNIYFPEYFDLTQILIGGSYHIYTLDVNGDTYRISAINIIEKHQTYLWCGQIIIRNISTSIDLIDTNNYLDLSERQIIVDLFASIYELTSKHYENSHTVIANSSITRFDNLKLFRNIDQINSVSDEIKLSDRDVTTLSNKFEPKQIDKVSTELSDIQQSYVNVLRQSSVTAPSVQYVFYPKSYISLLSDLDNCHYSENITLKEYAIQKIYAQYKTLPDTNKDLIKSVFAGSSILSKVSNRINESIDSLDDSFKIFYDKKLFNGKNSARLLVNYASIISTIVQTNDIEIRLTVDLSDSTFDLDLYNEVLSYFIIVEPYKSMTKIEQQVMMLTIFNMNKPSIRFTTLDDIDLVLLTQKTTEFNSSTNNDQYRVSGYLDTTKSQVYAYVSL